MRGKTLEDYRVQAPNTQVTAGEVRNKNTPGDHPPQDEDGSQDAVDRCGRENTKHPQAGLLLIESDGRPWGISYGEWIGSVQWFEPCTLVFYYPDVYEEDGTLKQGTFRVTIIGAGEQVKEAMQKLQERLIQHKRESLHCNPDGNFLREIRRERMKDEEGEDAS